MPLIDSCPYPGGWGDPMQILYQLVLTTFNLLMEIVSGEKLDFPELSSDEEEVIIKKRSQPEL